MDVRWTLKQRYVLNRILFRARRRIFSHDKKTFSYDFLLFFFPVESIIRSSFARIELFGLSWFSWIEKFSQSATRRYLRHTNDGRLVRNLTEVNIIFELHFIILYFILLLLFICVGGVMVSDMGCKFALTISYRCWP